MAKGFAASDGGAGFPTGLLSIVLPSVTFGNGFGKFIATFAKHVESSIACHSLSCYRWWDSPMLAITYSHGLLFAILYLIIHFVNERV
jgi:hypothetical protein